MLNSNIATVFYCASIIVLKERKQTPAVFFFSILFFLFSVFSYEVFAPLIFLNLLLVQRRKFLYLISIIIPILIYRQLIEPQLFNNYAHRSDVTQVLQVKRSIMVVFEITKTMTYDLFTSLFRSARAVAYFTVYDYLLFGLFNLFTCYYLSKKNIVSEFPTDLNIKFNFFLILGFFSAALIYFGSTYSPSLFGYHNRTLAGIRLYGVLIITYFLFKKANSYLIFFTILIFSVSAISVKNAWLYSFEINNDLFKKISFHNIPNTKNIKMLYVIFDQKNADLQATFTKQGKKDRNIFFSDPHFILKEPMYFETWESKYYVRKFSLNPTIKIEHFYSGDENKSKPYYLFDLTTDKLSVVK